MPITLGYKYKNYKAVRKVRGVPATLHPTAIDIAWAAGIYEGEGNCFVDVNGQKAGSSERVTVTQKDRWILDRFVELFGGKVTLQNKGRGLHCHTWNVYGARGRGFLMTIYKFLSPRRKLQIHKLNFLRAA